MLTPAGTIVARLGLAGNAGLRIDKQRGGSIISRAGRPNLACELQSVYLFPLISSLYWAGHIHNTSWIVKANPSQGSESASQRISE